MISYARSGTLFLFFLALSHAIIIKQLNRNRCETGSVSINLRITIYADSIS